MVLRAEWVMAGWQRMRLTQRHACRSKAGQLRWWTRGEGRGAVGWSAAGIPREREAHFDSHPAESGECAG
jgi:hypothetical protein